MGASTSSAEFGSAASHYEILAKLATGGMAEIFLARGQSTAGVERHVVLKRILRQRATDRHFVRMFLDEARLAAQLQHANVAQVFDIGRLGDSFFFTMEYVHGETVRALLSRSYAAQRALPIGCALAIAVGSLAGLHHAHERIGVDGRPLGIVHRDVSPSNLMVSYEGGVKVVDFGVAKASDRASETRSGAVKGKISYLSPEQCLGTDVDRRSDLFALGIVLWEMLVNDRLYRRNSDFENMAAIVHEAPPPPSSRRADVMPDLDALVLRLLAKTPDARFQNAAEAIEAIEGIAMRGGLGVSASSLARLMRDVFGARPEPWIDLDGGSLVGDGISVTSDPIPAELELAPEASVEQNLGGLPDLSARAHEDDPSDSLPPPGPLPRPSLPSFFNAPTRPVAPNIPDEARRSTSAPDDSVPMQSVVQVGDERSHSSSGSGSASGSGSGSGGPGAVVAMSAAALAPRSNTPSAPPVAATAMASDAVDGSRRHRSRVAIVLVPATVVGVLLGVWMSRWHRDTAPPTSHTIVMSSVAIDAAVTTASAGSAATATGTTAAMATAGSAIDTAVVADAGVGSSTPPPPSPPPTPASPPTIAQLFATGHIVDVVERCPLERAVGTDTVLLCAIAACRLHRDSDARRYMAALATKQRERVTAACPALATATPPPPPPAGKPDPCKTDPMACPH